MKDALKIIGELIKMGYKIFDTYKKEKDANKRKAIKKAIEKRDLAKLNKLVLNRK